jgi:glycerophosphoryl diester phosphodiesterase
MHHKNPLNFIVIITVIFCTLICWSNVADARLASLKKAWRIHYDRTLVMAHRGNHKEAPENTIPAFEKAIEAGADFVEIDARLTIDDQWVVYHDRVMMTPSGQRRVVSSMTLAEIRQKRINGRYYNLPDQIIPTLDEVLVALKGKILIFIDDKMSRPLALAEIVREHGMEDQVVIGINDYGDAILMSEFAKDIAWRAKIKPIRNDVQRYLALKPKIIEVYNVFALSEEDMKAIQRARVFIMACSFGHHDEDEYYSFLIEKVGVDIIQTDNLNRLLAYILKQQPKSS